MADPKPQRQVAAKQEHAAKARWEKRPEDVDAEAAPSDGANSADQHVADAAPVAESPAAAQAPVAAPSAAASSGPSFGLIGAGAAGVLGLVAAVAGGGGGGKSSDVTPPVVTAPQPEQPKPVDPKTPDTKPAEPKPADPTTPQTPPTQEPSHPDTTTPPTQPTQPTTPDHTTPPATPDQTPPPSQPDTTTTQPTTPDHTTPPSTPDQTQQPSQPDTTTTQPSTPDHTTPPATPDQTQQPSQPDTTTTEPSTPDHTTTPSTPDQTQQPSQPDTTPTQPTTPDHTTTPSTPDQTQQPSQPDTTTPPSTPDQPKQPDLPKLEVKLTVDSGYSDTDHITNKAGVTVSGLQATDTWRYSPDGGTTWTNRTGADGVIDASVFGSDGNKSIIVERDNSGAPLGEQAQLNFVLDTTEYSLEELNKGFNGLNWILQDGHPTLKLDFDSGANIRYLVTMDDYARFLEDTSGWKVASNNGVIDLVADLQVNKPYTYLILAVADAAGNWVRNHGFNDKGVLWHYFTDTPKFADPVLPSVALQSDTGISATDLVTGASTLVVSNLVEGMTWQYSLDNGETWKTGGSTKQIPASEIGFTEGDKHVLVKQINAAGKESEITHFDFTLKADDILGTAPKNPGEPTTFTGTAGIDHFVVTPEDGKQIQIQGFNADQNDVIDLRQVLTIPAGAKIENYIGTMYSGNGSHSFRVSPLGETSRTDDLYVSISGDSAPGSATKILYDGGQITLLTSNLPKLTANLVTDSGDSDSDRITNDATVEVSGLQKGEQWSYFIDGSDEFGHGTDEFRIPAAAFDNVEGAHTVYIWSDKRKDEIKFSFTLKADDIHAAPPDSNGVAHFTGTAGMDRFVVNPADGLNVHIQDFNADQGDVIDLSHVLSIPAGAKENDYVGGMVPGGVDHFFYVNQTGVFTTTDKLLMVSISGNYVPGSHTTVIYDGGKVVI